MPSLMVKGRNSPLDRIAGLQRLINPDESEKLLLSSVRKRLELLHNFKLQVVRKLLSRFTYTPTMLDITKIEVGSRCLFDIERQTVYLLHGDNMADQFIYQLTGFLGFPQRCKFELLQMLKSVPGNVLSK
jgi:hypothetical protein